MTVQSVAVKDLRPAQIAVGKRLVKERRKGLRARIREPQELVDYILEHPIRVVTGPKNRQYIVDHHHLAMALLEEGFRTAPVLVLGDLSKLAMTEFWKEMQAKGWLHPFDGKGQKQPISAIPTSIEDMQDDPYRSLAGFVRRNGGFLKSQTPFAEFVWADYYRPLIALKLVKSNFDKALKRAMKVSNDAGAVGLPGYVKKPVKKDDNDE
jgi:hypothetical protein